MCIQKQEPVGGPGSRRLFHPFQVPVANTSELELLASPLPIQPRKKRQLAQLMETKDPRALGQPGAAAWVSIKQVFASPADSTIRPQAGRRLSREGLGLHPVPRALGRMDALYKVLAPVQSEWPSLREQLCSVLCC